MKTIFKKVTFASVLSLSLIAGIAQASFLTFTAPLPSGFNGGESYSTIDFDPTYRTIAIRAYQKASSGSADPAQQITV